MVVGAILKAVFGAIAGYIIGWIIEFFPNFDLALTNGIHILTGIDITGQTRWLLTGLGFLLGLLAGVVRIISSGRMQ
ncbi:MAG TPA: hypothetical protein VK436_06630 [Methanocella sp.]|nr:hypothetical protein [Methanocella sp.]